MKGYLKESKKYKGFHYTELKPGMFEFLHSRSMEMLREVVAVLNRNGITYMICGGTLLGAATTGKFIPWDDDVDMCIFEKDYDAAIACLINELPDDMVLQCRKTEKRYYHGWVKVRDRKSKTYPGEPIYKENGIWIDIYKLIPMKASETALSRTAEHIAYLKRRVKSGSINKDEYWERVRKGRLLWKLIGGKMEAVLSLNRKNVCVLRSASGIVLDAQWCLPVKEYQFEGMTLTGFGRGERYLEVHYGGSYKKLPPKKLRQVSINKVETVEG